MGYEWTGSADEADLLIFNTCCVRQGAEDRLWGNLASLAHAEGARGLVAVCGCVAESRGVEILARFPEVGLVFGMEALGRLPQLIERSLVARVCDTGEVEEAEIDALPARRENTLRARVPVSHGCDNNCAYCVVPLVRGGERSRPASDIVEEVGALARAGVVEIELLGQNVNSYGGDLDEKVSFAEILGRVAGVPGIRRVKFETSHPRDLGREVLVAMSECGPLCEYLHLPVQSGSDRVLKAMNRGYDAGYYKETAALARQIVPGIKITTDIIVGFPGEDREDFERTLDLVRTVEFDAAYMFMYSPREGTPAWLLEDDVPVAEKKRRLAELSRLQGKITVNSLEKMSGARVEVLVEGLGRDPGQVVGRTRGNQVVVLDGSEAPLESLVTARVVSAGRHSLKGRVYEVLLEGGRQGTRRE
jgi:tRNA-2-methylthio-N6-dimethylallyladenosine synthase